MGKAIKRGAIAGIVGICAAILGFFLEIFFNETIGAGIIIWISFILYLVAYISYILFYLAFIILSKKNNFKSFEIISYIFVSVVIIKLLFLVLGMVEFGARGIAAIARFNLFVPNLFYLPEGSFSAFVLGALGGITILFGIDFFALKDKILLSKVIGLLNIIAGSLVIILPGFIGGVVLFVTFILEIVFLFSASEMYEKKISKRRTSIRNY